MITIRELIKNIAPGQSSMQIRLILRGLDSFHESIKNKIIVSYVRKELEGTTVFFKIPSETKSMSYDVCVWMDADSKPNINTAIKVYSNSPNFAYNFAYLFNTDGSLLFSNYYPASFLSIPPKTRNPLNVKAFDKHVYAAVKELFKFNIPEQLRKFSGLMEPRIQTFNQKIRERDTTS